MLKNELETPALLVDHPKMLRNIRAVQDLAKKAGVNLRPHAKTHKSAEIAKLQIDHGAVGICVQKLSEAEAMINSGVTDIFITNEVVEPSKIQRLVQLLEKARIKVAVDSLTNAQLLGEVASKQDRTLPVLLEVDCGMGRCGVLPGQPAIKIATAISKIMGVRLEGLMTYEGHLYHLTPTKRQHEARRIISRVIETAERIRKSVDNVIIVSCGSTPTAQTVANIPGVTEIQPGNYVFYDYMQVEVGSAKLNQCALSLLTTVLSKPSSTRIVVDAGIKTFSFDSSQFPRPMGHPTLKPMEMYEEHLVLKAGAGTKLQVGDKIELIPYHACTTVNMHDKLSVVENGEVIDTYSITARGRTL